MPDWSRKQLPFFRVNVHKTRNENKAKRPVGKHNRAMSKDRQTANEDAHTCVC